MKRFTSRKTAVVRIWAAIQNLKLHSGAAARRVEPSRARTAAKPGASISSASTRDGSKKAELLALVRREEGATLQELMTATSWQAHSVRGFLSGTLGKKMGLAIKSVRREDGQRVYSIAG